MASTARALLALSPAESKWVIGRAVAEHPAVRRALDAGVLVVSLGTTNAAVVEALTGEAVDPQLFAAGLVQGGYLCPSPAAGRLPPVVLDRGSRTEERPDEAVARAGSNAVVVKGGNAIDPEGRVGVLLASRDGGTVGQLLVRCRAAGSTVLAPVGLEKLVASVPAAARALGQDRITRSFGAPCGMMELVGAEPITEVHAFEALAGVEASHVASGGVAGSEGSVVLALAGPAAHVDRAVELAESARRRARKPAEPWKGPCEGCGFRCELRK